MSQRKFISRRDVLAAMATLGGLALAAPTLAARKSARRALTPGQTSGPFYPFIRLLDEDMDLTAIAGQVGRAKGQIIHLVGRVVNKNGAPVSGAKIEIWQANADGRYAHPDDINPAPLDENFQGFGMQLTDGQGRYRFKTIKPGAYPVSSSDFRTPHIHFHVAGAGNRLVTQMYFPGEQLNQTDVLLNALGNRKEAAIGKILPRQPGMETSALLIAWDIVLDT
jgi:protocatechuate 3,4-dioxygenase, beta subunit